MRRTLRIVRIIVDIVGEVRPMAQSEEKSRLGLPKRRMGISLRAVVMSTSYLKGLAFDHGGRRNFCFEVLPSDRAVWIDC
jgi:hypothetical protein